VRYNPLDKQKRNQVCCNTSDLLSWKGTSPLCINSHILLLIILSTKLYTGSPVDNMTMLHVLQNYWNDPIICTGITSLNYVLVCLRYVPNFSTLHCLHIHLLISSTSRQNRLHQIYNCTNACLLHKEINHKMEYKREIHQMKKETPNYKQAQVTKQCSEYINIHKSL
jgi:hypothetical protein